jgi:hypothetical protein
MGFRQMPHSFPDRFCSFRHVLGRAQVSEIKVISLDYY